MIENNLGIVFVKIQLDEDMVIFLREIAFNENQEVFENAFEKQIEAQWNEIEKVEKFSIERIVSLLNSIKKNLVNMSMKIRKSKIMQRKSVLNFEQTESEKQ